MWRPERGRRRSARRRHRRWRSGRSGPRLLSAPRGLRRRRSRRRPLPARQGLRGGDLPAGLASLRGDGGRRSGPGPRSPSPARDAAHVPGRHHVPRPLPPGESTRPRPASPRARRRSPGPRPRARGRDPRGDPGHRPPPDAEGWSRAWRPRAAKAHRTRWRGRLVVGADGRNSVVASRLDLRRPHPRLRRFAVRGFWEGMEDLGEHGEMHVGGGGYCGLAPLSPTLANVAFVLPAREMARGGRGRRGLPPRRPATPMAPRLGAAPAGSA